MYSLQQCEGVVSLKLTVNSSVRCVLNNSGVEVYCQLTVLFHIFMYNELLFFSLSSSFMLFL